MDIDRKAHWVVVEMQLPSDKFGSSFGVMDLEGMPLGAVASTEKSRQEQYEIARLWTASPELLLALEWTARYIQDLWNSKRGITPDRQSRFRMHEVQMILDRLHDDAPPTLEDDPDDLGIRWVNSKGTTYQPRPIGAYFLAPYEEPQGPQQDIGAMN